MSVVLFNMYIQFRFFSVGVKLKGKNQTLTPTEIIKTVCSEGEDCVFTQANCLWSFLFLTTQICIFFEFFFQFQGFLFMSEKGMTML